MLICGEWEARAIRVGASHATMKRLRRTGRFRFEYQPELQHGLLIASQRAAVVEMVSDHVIERFAPPASRSGHSRDARPGRETVNPGVVGEPGRVLGARASDRWQITRPSATSGQVERSGELR